MEGETADQMKGGRKGKEIGGAEGGRGGRRVCAEANHNWPDSGRWYGAVAGWNMCVWGWGEDYGVTVEVIVYTISRLLLYHRNCTSLN